MIGKPWFWQILKGNYEQQQQLIRIKQWKTKTIKQR